MLDSLLDGIKGQVAGTLAEKVGIDLDQAEKAVPLAGDSIKEGIIGAVTEGNTGDIMSMFSSLTGGGDSGSGGLGGAASMLSGLAGGGNSGDGGGIGDMMKNMVFKNIASNYVGKLTSSLGLPAGIANTISTMALPMIMNKIKGSASNDAGEVNASGLMDTLGLDAGSLLSGGTDAIKDQAMDAIKDKLGGGLGKLFG
jgi:hypothetical protein